MSNHMHIYKSILKSIRSGNLSTNSQYAKQMMNKGVDLGYYTKADLIEAVLELDKKELSKIIYRIKDGRYNPNNIWVSSKIKEGLKREFIEQNEIDDAIEKYKVRKR